MENTNYSVLVRPYAYGQYRILLTELGTPIVTNREVKVEPIEKENTVEIEWNQYDTVGYHHEGAPPGHGDICKLLDTYQPDVMVRITTLIRNSSNPKNLIESFRRHWNSNGSSDRIRLDNRPADKPEIRLNQNITSAIQIDNKFYCCFCVSQLKEIPDHELLCDCGCYVSNRHDVY